MSLSHQGILRTQFVDGRRENEYKEDEKFSCVSVCSTHTVYSALQ